MNLTYIRERKNNKPKKVFESKIITNFNSLKDIEGLGFKNEYQEHIVESVNNVIEECDNLFLALECVGAMYCIPSSHMMRDDDLGTIKIAGTNAIAPGNISAVGNKEAIVKAVSALLDKNSENIDDEINHHHHHHCHDLMREQPQFSPDPSKGTVIGRYLDSEGNEILVYNSGIVDCRDPHASKHKIEELRANGLIPEYNPDVIQGGGKCKVCNSTSDYFADMDDITKDVDMTAGDDIKATPITDTTKSYTEPSENDFGTTDIASSINENKTLVEACSIFDHTHNLGYELMKQQGFDYVKPTLTIIKEATAEDAETIAGGGIDPHEFEFMRFDNKHIISAVKLINDWVEKKGAAGISDVPFDELYKSDEFSFAIDELNEQFDARIRVHYRPSGTQQNVYTTCDDTQVSELRKLKLSKTKGFQFSNNPINIYIIGKHTIRDLSLGKVEFTGQTIISILLHEIFHNAMWVWKINDTEFSASFAVTLQLATQEKSAKKRRKIITNYVNMIDKYYGCDLNKIKRRILVKRLTALTAMSDPSVVKKLKNTLTNTLADHKRKNNKEPIPDKDVLETINMYEKYMKNYQKHLKKKSCILNILLGAAGIFGSVLLFKGSEGKRGKSQIGLEIAGCLTGSAGLLFVISGITATIERALIKEAKKNYENTKDLEEQWCDMFSAMYKLPVTFKIATVKRRAYTDDQLSKDVVERFNKVDIEIHKMILDCHPSGTERNYQAVKISKELLKNEELLNPEIKKYLEWVTEAYKHTGDNEEIEDIYNKAVFDPSEAESLDDHLAHLIEATDVPLVEYTAYDVLDWGITME